MIGDDPPSRSIPAPPKFNSDHIEQNNAAVPTSSNESPNYTSSNAAQQRITALPPPKFTAPSISSSRQAHAQDPAKAAALAAAKAAQHATPAQRERLVMEAAAQAIAQRTAAIADAEQDPSTHPQSAPMPPKAPSGPYEPPSWASIPASIPLTMEVMKQGTIISTLDLRQLSLDSGKAYLTLGRAPDNDILLDHPSSSRLHAILEFNGESGGIFLYDPGSTHGCYVNKARIAAGEHVALRVGDMLRFGESSRTHILCGPVELMAQEGPSREERRQAAAMNALQRRKEKDAAAAEAAMARAIAGGGIDSSGGGGVSWGFGEDAMDDEDQIKNLDEIDWRAYSANRGLSEKQQKIADKIRKRELRIVHLQKESEKIQAKQRSMEELSVGQANTLARNEEDIEKAMVEMDELEDQLMDSIRNSLGQKKSKKGTAGGATGMAGRKRRRGTTGRGSDDDQDVGGTSDDDSFYDRTGKSTGGKNRGVRRRGGAGNGGRAEVEVEDAGSLYGKLETLKEERTNVEEKLKIEMAKPKIEGCSKDYKGTGTGTTYIDGTWTN